MIGETFVGTAMVENGDQLRASFPELRNIYLQIHDFSDTWGLAWLDFVSLSAAILGFKPEPVIEVGRGFGNSTATFAYWGARVISVCRTDYWCRTKKELVANLGENTFESIDAIVGEY